MKMIVFVMVLAFQGQMAPPHEEEMESLEACQARVAASTADFLKIDENFIFVAGCRIVSKKLDPA